jgi:HJR/Mrr/RecB family endonuclease
MKVKLKTSFWEDKDNQEWRSSVSSVILFTVIIGITNLVYTIYTKAVFLYIINGIYLAFFVLVYLSYFKYKKEVVYDGTGK